MTDTLADRLAALVDPTAPAGWSDVRRRVRKRTRRVTASLALAAAAIACAAAVAASNNWVFGSNAHEIYGATYFQFQGKEYTLQVEAHPDDLTFPGRSFGLVLSRGRQAPDAPRATDVITGASGGSILAVPGLPQKLLPHPPKPTGPAFGAINYDHAGGQIWFGDARPEITRITITDTHGHRFTEQTGTPPPPMKLAFRFWAIALPASTATTISGYDSHGKLIDRRSIWGLKNAMFLH